MAKMGLRYHSGDWLTEHITVVRKTLRHSVDIHMHSFYEIEFIKSGQGSIVLNGQSYKLQAGSLMLLTPIDFHSVNPDKPLDIINISFHESLVKPVLQNIFVSPNKNILLQLSALESEIFCRHTDMLEAELKNNDEFSENERESLLNTILVSIARYMRITNDAAPCSDLVRLYASISYLLQNFTGDLSLDTVAAQSGYTPNYFSKLFKELTGRTYIDFLNSLRVNYARMLLTSTNDSVLEISQNSGFDSPSNFARVFKELTTETPLSYRKKRQMS